MNHLVENFYTQQSHVFELLALMFRLNNHEYLNEGTPEGRENNELNEYITYSRAVLSKETKEELDCFFHNDSFFGLTLSQLILEHNKADDIQAFIEFLEDLPVKQMMSSFIKSGYSFPEDTPNMDDRDAVFNFIKSSMLPFNEQAKLLYLYVDEEKTKARFIRLIKEINEAFYEPSMDKIAEVQERSINKLSSMDGDQIRGLLQRNFSQMEVPKEKFNKVILIPSYYYQHASLFTYGDEADTVMTLFGTETLDAPDDSNEEDIIDLVAALSDPTKFNIIKALNIAPRYGFELAQQLNVSGPTISHHISKLSKLGLIRATRKGNKIYFKSNREKIERTLAEMSAILTKREE
ncbi:MAG TPA: winged helix-turn-helix domain-containing protein [Aliicoccus persicus]|uniref:Winged helix-turn-helix domain-containing protein n=1 Tax=Aliicoccus persicus TaxID=930138 RepID=A0A921DWU9_9STAP|nr:winged helix-turn-helix domain-containing protein [Aliicoccus persicus]